LKAKEKAKHWASVLQWCVWSLVQGDPGSSAPERERSWRRHVLLLWCYCFHRKNTNFTRVLLPCYLYICENECAKLKVLETKAVHGSFAVVWTEIRSLLFLKVPLGL